MADMRAEACPPPPRELLPLADEKAEPLDEDARSTGVLTKISFQSKVNARGTAFGTSHAHDAPSRLDLEPDQFRHHKCNERATSPGKPAQLARSRRNSRPIAGFSRHEFFLCLPNRTALPGRQCLVIVPSSPAIAATTVGYLLRARTAFGAAIETILSRPASRLSRGFRGLAPGAFSSNR
jgi:hypothetical protein